MIRKINDTLLYLLFSFLLGTGIMLKYTFVKGAGMQTVMAMGKHDWETLHLYAGFATAACALLHILLNAKFVKNAICKKSKAAAVLFVAAGLALAFGIGFYPKKTAKPAAHAALQSCPTQK